MEGQAHSSVNAEAQKVFAQRRQIHRQQQDQEQQTITVIVLTGCDNCGSPIDEPEKWVLCHRCRTPNPNPQKEDGLLLPASAGE